MTAYHFEQQFADAVATGKKTQTVRKVRKRHAMLGDPVQLFVASRTQGGRKLVDPDPICTLNTYCAVREDGITLGMHPKVDLADFAQRDGFANFEAMKAWFRDTYGLPFFGRLIVWKART